MITDASTMQSAVRKMGNSAGIILPRSILGAAGVEIGTAMELQVEGGRIIATPVTSHPRAGWAEAAMAIGADTDQDAADWQNFANTGDDDWTW
jgi:antitoxin MazE